MAARNEPKPPDPKRHDERVRLRAYHLWESEGRPLGRNEEFWDRAHTEIIEEIEGAGAAKADDEPKN